MSKIGIFFIIVVIFLGVGYFFFSQKSENSKGVGVVEMMEKTFSKNVDLKATFEINTNGTKRIFTDSKYHNLSPFVFITKDAPNTINVKKDGITWSNFFETLPMKLTSDCLITGTGQVFCSGVEGTLSFYINGIQDPAALTKIIKDGDKLLVEYQ